MAIKRTVKNQSALNKFALDTGSTVVSEKGRKFNTGKKRAGVKKPVPANPAPSKQKAVTEIPAVASDNYLADKVESVGKANIMMLAELKNQIAQIQLQSVLPILEWEFDMIRDSKGYLTKIKASGSVTKNTIN